MKRPVRFVGMVTILAVCAAAGACAGGQNSEPASSSGTSSPPPPRRAPQTQSADSGDSAEITYRSEPDPPESGDNMVEVTVKQPDGTPVTDAAVTAVFSMPAMPSMNMPAMRSDATLTHSGDGTYRGTSRLSMGGTWNVTVNVERAGARIGVKRFSVVAK